MVDLQPPAVVVMVIQQLVQIQDRVAVAATVIQQGVVTVHQVL
jgi:hypothetical protein